MEFAFTKGLLINRGVAFTVQFKVDPCRRAEAAVKIRQIGERQWRALASLVARQRPSSRAAIYRADIRSSGGLDDGWPDGFTDDDMENARAYLIKVGFRDASAEAA